jgi:Fe-S cluster assembly protein SufD
MEAVISSINKVSDFLENIDVTENVVSDGRVQEAINDAKSRLLMSDLPHKKQEDWKYSKIAPWLRKRYKVSRSNEDVAINKLNPLTIQANTLVFLNGFYRDDLSTLKHSQNGVIIQNMTEAIDLFREDFETYFNTGTEDSFFTDLNTVYHSNGVFIKVDENVIAETVVHILHIQTGSETIAQSRNLVILGKNAKIDILESQLELNAQDSISNHVSEFFIKENALLNYTLIQKGSENAAIHSNYFEQEDFSKINSNVFSLQNKLIRNNHRVRSIGKDTETRLNGSFMPGKEEQFDNRTLLDHRNVRGYSEEVYKGILFEKSDAVFYGRIYVDQKAQQTNAYLNNSNILMDDSARMHSKPELEIYADDVKCSHGSATGDFDTEAQFYLQARGIGIESARKMLIHAFMDEVSGKIESPEMRDLVNSYMNERMMKLD